MYFVYIFRMYLVYISCCISILKNQIDGKARGFFFPICDLRGVVFCEEAGDLAASFQWIV